MTANGKKTEELVSFKEGQWTINDKETRERVEKIIIEMGQYAQNRKQDIEELLEGKATVSVFFRLVPAE